MSMRQGYGVNDDNIVWIDDVDKELFNGIKNTDSYLKEMLEKCETKYAEEDFEDMFAMFCEDYENPSYGWWGFEGVMVDYIDEIAFNGRNMLRYEDSCYYVDAVDALEAEISLNEIRDKLSQFLFPLVKEEPDIRWYDIRF